jgi:glycine dehydrogenase
MRSLLNRNKPLYLIGQGYQNCIIPNVIKNHFLRNPHIYTPYTPYQSEISQGRLELLYTYQQIMKNIFHKDIAIASLIDSGQIAMDMITLMKNKTKKQTILVQESCYQTLMNCLYTRAKHQNINIQLFSTESSIHEQYTNDDLEKVAGIIIQTPDTYGNIFQKYGLEEIKIKHPNIIVACNTDVMPHIHYNLENFTNVCDFLFGNAGNMGVGLNYGGPQPAFLVSNKNYIRDLPGKIVGKSITKYGDECFRLALQTREQHIRREKATSNVCTNQALLANMSAAWMMYHGDNGLKNIANNIHHKTNTLIKLIKNKEIINSSLYNTITIKTDRKFKPQEQLLRDIYTYNRNNLVSITIDETHDDNDIEIIANIVNQIIPSHYLYIPELNNKYSQRTQPICDNKYDTQYDEQQLSRYLFSLSQKDYSLMNGAIPLGSCTMKYTPVESMERVTNEDYNIHPYVPIHKTPYYSIINELSNKLMDITGFDYIFYQSQSGAMGEYAGLTTIKNYHLKQNNNHKDIILMPRSAHGTNASTAKLAGFKVKYINENNEGMIDMNHLYTILEGNNNIAGLMITYPSTYGLFEKNIRDINILIHNAGGLVYMDGANMNALMGKERSADLGFDVCHFNLHKTFAIPHGGGGPGMGPIGVKKFLTDYLPSFSIDKNCYSISTTPYGSGNILQISHEYTKQFNKDNLETFHKHIIERTNNIIKRLKPYFNIYHSFTSQYRAHEFIIDCRPFKKYGIVDVDISKRLMDYGFHAPTMSWPVHNSLMIEITETEPEEEITRFITSLIKIKYEIENKPELLLNAPHTQKDIMNWNYDYSIEEACFPMGEAQINKFWATINRVDDKYGDLNWNCCI